MTIQNIVAGIAVIAIAAFIIREIVNDRMCSQYHKRVLKQKQENGQ